MPAVAVAGARRHTCASLCLPHHATTHAAAHFLSSTSTATTRSGQSYCCCCCCCYAPGAASIRSARSSMDNMDMDDCRLSGGEDCHMTSTVEHHVQDYRRHPRAAPLVFPSSDHHPHDPLPSTSYQQGVVLNPDLLPPSSSSSSSSPSLDMHYLHHHPYLRAAAGGGPPPMSLLEQHYRDALYATPHHLAAAGYLSSEALSNALVWDQWLCCLATALTPLQWQQYWSNYATLLGAHALPTHLLSFFAENDVERWSLDLQAAYGNACSKSEVCTVLLATCVLQLATRARAFLPLFFFFYFRCVCPQERRPELVALCCGGTQD
uniref:Uncharacterized protein n=1 Tax=Plectus sambesii TaxID=2011161 RepID=A0A914UKK4_9BILA